jgi:hypothetical protein
MNTDVCEQLLRDATSKMLEAHLAEIDDECIRIAAYCRELRQDHLTADEREMYEAKLYAALTHLQNHIGPAIEEWDRVDDALPDDDD